MSSTRVTRSSRAAVRPEGPSPTSVPGSGSLKRPRSRSSDSELDSLHPSKRSCLKTVSSTDGTDDYDDMPSLQSLTPSPLHSRAPTPWATTTARPDPVLGASKELAALVPVYTEHIVNSPVGSMTVETLTDIVNVTHVPSIHLDIPATQAPPPGDADIPDNDSEDIPMAPPDLQVPDGGAADNDDGHDQFDGVSYLPRASLDRAETFAGKSDLANLRFAIGKVPANAMWGTSPNTEKFLCISDRPITVWLVGKVVTTWFMNLEGQPQPRVNIGFTLPHKGDDDGLRRLLDLARPRRDDVPPVIYASRFQSRQKKGETGASIVPFKNIYDARTKFRAKSEMHVIPSSHIGRNDLVLVEAYFNRWKTAKDKKNRKSWTLWDVGFELQCISLLAESPPNADDDEPLPNADVEDDM